MNSNLANIARSRPVAAALSPVVRRVAPGGARLAQQQQYSSGSSRIPLRPRYRQYVSAQGTADESASASIDEAKLREEIIKIEVIEPVVEQKAESAALTVAAAAAFGAGIWAVLGRGKAEGKKYLEFIKL
jgi:hypothetical protein